MGSENNKKTLKERIAGLSEEKRYRIENSNIPLEFWNYKWTDYDPNFMEKGKIIEEKEIKISRYEARKLCITYSRAIKEIYEDRIGSSLVILGKSGSGKSVLGTLILRDVIFAVKESVLYVTYNQFAMEADTSFFREHKEGIEDKYLSPEWLMIDEVEPYYANDASIQRVQKYLHYILMQRSSMKLPTIITSNVTIGYALEKVIGPMAYKDIMNLNVYWPFIEIKGSRSQKDVYTDLPKGKYDLDKILSEIKKQKTYNQNKINQWEDNKDNNDEPKYSEDKYTDGETLSGIIQKGIVADE